MGTEDEQSKIRNAAREAFSAAFDAAYPADTKKEPAQEAKPAAEAPERDKKSGHSHTLKDKANGGEFCIDCGENFVKAPKSATEVVNSLQAEWHKGHDALGCKECRPGLLKAIAPEDKYEVDDEGSKIVIRKRR